MATAASVLSGDSGSGNGAAASGGASGGASGANGASAGGLPTAAASGWWDSVKDTDTKSWLTTKNFPDAEKALMSYRNLETLFGADKAGRTALLPKDENDAEGWSALSKKLGVPDSADGYKLPMPDGTDPAFSKTASQWFHEAGVPPRAASKIAERWNAYMGEQIKAGEVAERAESDKQMAGLEKEWGAEFGPKRELAQRGYREFAKQFGLDDKAALERAESVLGAANLTKLFAGLGSLNSESGFAGSDAKGGFSGVSKTQALARVQEIQAKRVKGEINDHAWRTQFEPELMKLGPIAYG